MSSKVSIEVDEHTAGALQARATELGMTVSELIAELAAAEANPTAIAPDEVAELDRRWKHIEAGKPTVSQDQVVRWLRTW